MEIIKIKDDLYIGIKEDGRVTIAQESWKNDNTFTEIHIRVEDVLEIAKIVENKQK